LKSIPIRGKRFGFEPEVTIQLAKRQARIYEVLGRIRRYSREHLAARLEEAGLELETILDFNRISCLAWFVSGRILRREAISRLQLRRSDRLVWLLPCIGGMIPWNPASIIVIARKPETQYTVSDARSPILRRFR
jgi:hypothetical protein